MLFEFIIPRQTRLNDLRQALGQRFSVQEQTAVTLTRHCQDSFDWLLYRNRQAYFFEQVAGQVQLSLYSTATQKNTLRVSQFEVPRFAHDVQSRVFQRRLAALIDVRALLDVMVVNIRRHTLCYVDADAKTRLYIHIEDCRLSLNNGKQRLLGKRIRLQPVKGYAAALQQVSRFLQRREDVFPAEQDLFEQGLQMLNIDPLQITAKPVVSLCPDMRSDQALKQILKPSLLAMQANHQGVIDDTDSEFLHDFRVAVRRTRSALGLVKNVFAQRTLDRFNKGFKWLGAMTGPTRDIHVYLLKFDAYRQQLAPEQRPHLEPMRRFLEKHLRIEHRALARTLKSRRYQLLVAAWSDFLEAPPPRTARLQNAATPVKQTADRLIWKAFRKLLKQGARIDDDSPDEKLHRLRISAKKLRYLLEFFTSLYSAKKMKSLIKGLKQLQDILGDFQDLCVQAGTIHDMQQQMRAENMLSEDTRQAMEQLVDHFNRHKLQLRGHYAERFAVFASDVNQRAFHDLFYSRIGCSV